MSMSDEIKRHQKAIENMQLLEQSYSSKPDMLDFVRSNADRIYTQYRTDATQVGGLVRNLAQRDKWEKKFVDSLGGTNWRNPFSAVEDERSPPGSLSPTTALSEMSPVPDLQVPELSPLKRFLGRYIPSPPAEAATEPSAVLQRICQAVGKNATSWTFVDGPAPHNVPGAVCCHFELRRVTVSPILCEVVAYAAAAPSIAAGGLGWSAMLDTWFFDTHVNGLREQEEVSVADWLDCVQEELASKIAAPRRCDFWLMLNGEWHWNEDLFACRRLSGRRVSLMPDERALLRSRETRLALLALSELSEHRPRISRTAEHYWPSDSGVPARGR
jgi:hypothetical protein